MEACVFSHDFTSAGCHYMYLLNQLTSEPSRLQASRHNYYANWLLGERQEDSGICFT